MMIIIPYPHVSINGNKYGNIERNLCNNNDDNDDNNNNNEDENNNTDDINNDE